MRTSDQQARVVGQLALGIREGRLLIGARDVEYRVDDHGAIVVDWVEGPYPSEVAAGLAAYSAVGWLQVDAVAPDPVHSGTVRADLLVDGLPVTLLAYDAIGMEQAARVARPKRALSPWRWPSPLTAEGAARDTVLWTFDRDLGLVATVVRLPIDPQGPWWTEDGTNVAVAPQDMPPGVRARRREMIDEFRDHCAILLRYGATWTPEDADKWMTAELDRADLRAPDSVAVVWRGRCIMRRWTGQRMEITCAEPPALAPWTYVPSAVHASLVRDRSRRDPPGSLGIRAFGNASSVLRVTITSTWGAPSQRFSDSPGLRW
ncbi:hypothetical protein [Lentzea sp. NBRC 105346]|uniref:hypothetical protein n=1 Tax=Lentzea sp. NBRC 105346 TaxID=3032205 RepID=UPI002553BBC7|nr:hypothetical protein [Lentzea sp. NBRC 105346]